jgi:hypothetical protein
VYIVPGARSDMLIFGRHLIIIYCLIYFIQEREFCVRKRPKAALLRTRRLSYSVGSNATKIVTRKSVEEDRGLSRMYFSFYFEHFWAISNCDQCLSVSERAHTRVFPERCCVFFLSRTHT